MVYFGALICQFSTKPLLRLHGFLLTRLFSKVSKNSVSRGAPVLYPIILENLLYPHILENSLNPNVSIFCLIKIWIKSG